MKLKIFSAKCGSFSTYETITVEVDPGYKVISGGAELADGDILMKASYPSSATSWTATFKDHLAGYSGGIVGYAVGLYDPNNEWDVVITTASSNMSPSPSIKATVAEGYQMTGGGAEIIDGDANGIVIFGNFPFDDKNWMAVGNEHYFSGTGQIKSYAIGVRHKVETDCPSSCSIASEISTPAQHPVAVISRPDQVIVGGGAAGTLPEDGDGLAGNALIITAPQLNGKQWLAKAKDHKIIQFGHVTCYAIECPADQVKFM